MSSVTETKVVLDVSLLAPQSHDLLEGLLKEGNLTFVATPEMLKVLIDIDKYRGLLRLWNIDTRYAKLITNFVHRVKLIERTKSIALEDLIKRDLIKQLFEFLLEQIEERGVAEGILKEFLAKEMCLALAGYPILCTAASRWKIVEFFERIGANVGRKIDVWMEKKAEMLKTKNFRLLVLAKGLKAALVYVLTGPLEAFAFLGSEVISLVIVDG